MLTRKVGTWVLFAAIVWVGLHLLTPPGPPYEVKTPHASGWTRFLNTGFPTVEACGTPPCDGTESKLRDSGCLYCPHCYNGPCTIRECKETGNMTKKCVYRTWPQGNQCAGCRDDHNVGCREGAGDSPGDGGLTL
jgi:hypothetical protein